jgi:hypothetical protein
MVMGPKRKPDTKRNWSTDRRSQYNLNLSQLVVRRAVVIVMRARVEQVSSRYNASEGGN